MAAKKQQSWRVLVGVNYPQPGRSGHEKRAEPDDVVDDIPASVVELWLEQGVIEAVS